MASTLASDDQAFFRERTPNAGAARTEATRRPKFWSVEKLVDIREGYHSDNQIDHGLNERLQKLEKDLEFACQRADSADSRLNEADATISELREDVSQLQHEVQELKEKNIEYVMEKIEAEAGAQLREAAISVLKLRIYALEGDLQKERDTRGSKSSPNTNTKTLTQLSPDIDVEIKARPGLVVKKDGNSNSEYATAKLEAAKYQSQEDAKTIRKLKQINSALETDLEKERAHNACFSHCSSDAWSIKKMKKLEQTLAEAHERYTLLRKEMNDLRLKKTPSYLTERNILDQEEHSQNFGQYSQETLDDISETSQLVQELLGDDFKYNASSNSAHMYDGKSEEDRTAQQQRPERVEVPRLFW
ncbi:hypothetical protein L7F22_009833 [Adiantum nelumboides]|nr:hypothetical protein [Adiantum nelumboides]